MISNTAHTPSTSNDSKRNVALKLKATGKAIGDDHIISYLDELLDPSKSIQDCDSIESCKWFIAGGLTPDEFNESVSRYDFSPKCGLVWHTNFIAYRCRTCGISPCMSLCADCFLGGSHEGHDFNMFKSQSGGACDCGDSMVIKEEGFCPKHGAQMGPVVECPSDLLYMGQLLIPRLIQRIVLFFRNCYGYPTIIRALVPDSRGISEADDMLWLMINFCKIGNPIRNLYLSALNNKELYHKLIVDICNLNPASATDKRILKLHSIYQQADEIHSLVLQSQHFPPLNDYLNNDYISYDVVHQTFLDELVFWTLKFEFPQMLVTFLLQLLPDDKYKDVFGISFVKQYPFIGPMLLQSSNVEPMTNRLVHISVQLFSNEQLAMMLIKKQYLLHILLTSLLDMLSKGQTHSALHNSPKNFHYVVNCSDKSLANHCYWPIVSDFINIISHKSVAHHVLADDELIGIWLNLVGKFTGMNVNKRQLTHHIEYEPQSYYSAFSAEIEACSIPFLSLLLHVQDPSWRPLVKRLAGQITDHLIEWCESIGIESGVLATKDQVSFHFPLHRYLAIILAQSVRKFSIPIDEITPTCYQLKRFVVFILALRGAISEISCNMWVRNGIQMKGQMMTYVQANFADSLVDPDMYLLQLCASRLDSNWFIRSVFTQYRMDNYLNLVSKSRDAHIDEEQEISMLEGAFALLVAIAVVRTNTGNLSEHEVMREEFITQICLHNRTFSQLVEVLQESHMLPKQSIDIDSLVGQFTNVEEPHFEPGAVNTGRQYSPKPFVWQKFFDPIHVWLRAMNRRDVQLAMERFSLWCKKDGHSDSPWPPLRPFKALHTEYKGLENILISDALHGAIFTILYKTVRNKFPSIHNDILYYCLYLLKLAVEISLHNTTGIPVTKTSDKFSTSEYHRIYHSNHIYTNLIHLVDKVVVAYPKEKNGSNDEEMELGSSDDLILLSTSVISFVANSVSVSRNVAAPVPADSHCSLPILVPNASSSASSRKLNTTPSDSASSFSKTNGSNNLFEVNETLLGLLLKLLDKLSATACSYRISDLDEHLRLDIGTFLYVIGDGVIIVKSLIGLIVKTNPACESYVRSYVTNAVQDFESSTTESSMTDVTKSSNAKLERRKKAAERQQRLVEQFAKQQKQFIETITPSSDDLMPEFQEDESFNCIICNQTSLSTLQKPIGLIILAQSTTLPGLMKPIVFDGNPLSFCLPSLLDKTETSCFIESDRLSALDEDYSYALSSVCWKSTISIKTCGHHVHNDCIESYIGSLSNQHYHQHLHKLEHGEFTCPLCRQLSNGFLPIKPDQSVPKLNVHKVGLFEDADSGLLLPRSISQDDQCIVAESAYTNSRKNFLDTVALYVECNNMMPPSPNSPFYSAHNLATLSLPLGGVKLLSVYHSFLRAYVDLDLQNIGMSFDSQTQKRKSSLRVSCFGPLVKLLHDDICSKTNSSAVDEILSNFLNSSNSEVSYILSDAISMLFLFIVHRGLPKRDVFASLVQRLFNLCYCQAIVKVISSFSSDERKAWCKVKPPSQTLECLVVVLLTYLEPYLTDPIADISVSQNVWTLQSLETRIISNCMYFLRILSLTSYHLFHTALPQCSDPSEEFWVLADYLSLGGRNRDSSINTLSLSVPYSPVIASWLGTGFHQMRLTLSLPTFGGYTVSSLAQLPDCYDILFRHYTKLPCENCGAASKDPGVCLVCGTMICMRQSSCRCSNQPVCETVQHAIKCGAGTAIYLKINESTIVIIRGKRAGIWGSVYLDSHGEEDRGLRRGKPLYLDRHRYNILEGNWRSVNIDNAIRRWVFHQNELP